MDKNVSIAKNEIGKNVCVTSYKIRVQKLANF